MSAPKEQQMPKVPKMLTKEISRELDMLESRLEKLENEKTAIAAKSGLLDKSVVDEVRRILYS